MIFESHSSSIFESHSSSIFESHSSSILESHSSSTWNKFSFSPPGALMTSPGQSTGFITSKFRSFNIQIPTET